MIILLVTIWLLYIFNIANLFVSLITTILVIAYKGGEFFKTKSHINTTINNIDAVFDIKAVFYEYRKESIRGYSRVGKGVGVSKNFSSSKLSKIDKGKLILTQNKLIFDGKQINKSMPLNKIISVKISGLIFKKLAISLDGRQKTLYFRIDNISTYQHKIKQSIYE